MNTENTDLVKKVDMTHTGWEMADEGLIRCESSVSIEGSWLLANVSFFMCTMLVEVVFKLQNAGLSQITS